ncbi:MAG: DUF1214 domain-containing protein [Myxococcales bacterium]|nr:DUF1214 domain-containing protein [Myxococcales bacterium]MCB9628356.1 DUF1214 domain-containing protein [Sandaracinaceae bacterium]
MLASTSPFALALLALIGVLVLVLGVSLATRGVRGTVVGVLELYRRARLAWLGLTNRTEASESERRVVSGEAWAEWCDTLKAAGASLTSAGCPTAPFDQAEGYRYLTRLVRGSLENYLECSDPHAPVLVALANGMRDAPVKLGADNPDNLYLNANLDPRETYRLVGARGTVNYLGLGIQEGTYGGAGGLRTVAYKEAGAGDFDTRPDGTLEVVISREPPASGDERNWLPLPGGDATRAMLIVRQTFRDREREEPAALRIERTSGPHRPTALTCAQLEDALRTSGMFVAGASMMFARWAKGFQAHANELPLFDQQTSDAAGGDPKIRYYHSYWKLAPDEALVITATPPPCQHWNFQLNNHWMESLDYRYFQVHVNIHSAHYDAEDGSVRVVVAHRDPRELIPDGVAYDWINTCSHSQGQMLWRWVRVAPEWDTESGRLPQPVCRVVKFEALGTLGTLGRDAS